jgi:integrase
MPTTYAVRMESIQKNKLAGKNRYSYTVRWRVAGTRPKKTYATFAQADSRRSELISAMRRGEAFDIETGLPESELRAIDAIGFYQFACDYVDLKWPHAAANTRRSTADALVAIAPVMLKSTRGMPDAKLMRKALHKWGFNTAHRADAPPEIEKVLTWVRSNSLPVSALGTAARIRAALNAVGSKLDGKPASSTYTARRRAVLWNLCDYAVELGQLNANPIPTVKRSRTKRSVKHVDPATVPNPDQARALLAAVAKRPGAGPRMAAFFGSMYFAALRPAEAVELSESNLILPEEGWGKIVLNDSNPYAGSAWTDSGESHDHRQLKHREVGEERPVPCPPELTAMFHHHISTFGTAPDGRLFWGQGRGTLSAKYYQAMWQQVREDVLGAKAAKVSSLAQRPYDLRHAAVSSWLASGVEPARIAGWAGHSLEVLLRIYAKVIDNQEDRALALIDTFLAS